MQVNISGSIRLKIKAELPPRKSRQASKSSKLLASDHVDLDRGQLEKHTADQSLLQMPELPCDDVQLPVLEHQVSSVVVPCADEREALPVEATLRNGSNASESAGHSLQVGLYFMMFLIISSK